MINNDTLMETLHYTVAGHHFSLVTTNAAATRALLPNFDPFLTDEGFRDGIVEPDRNKVLSPPKQPKGEAVPPPLFRFAGNALFSLPVGDAADDFEWNGIHYRLFRTADGWVISMQQRQHHYLLRATHDWQRAETDLSLTAGEEEPFINNFLSVTFSLATASLHTLKVHASVTELNGRALLFLGKSGTGKSTHSSLWHRFVPGCTLLNDDEPVVRIGDDGVVRVYGTPWSGKTPCYRNAAAEVVAFVHLYQSPENRLTLLRGRDAFTSLFSSSAIMRCDAANRNTIFNNVADILERVPVYRLDCRPDREAVSLTESLMS